MNATRGISKIITLAFINRLRRRHHIYLWGTATTILMLTITLFRQMGKTEPHDRILFFVPALLCFFVYNAISAYHIFALLSTASCTMPRHLFSAICTNLTISVLFGEVRPYTESTTWLVVVTSAGCSHLLFLLFVWRALNIVCMESYSKRFITRIPIRSMVAGAVLSIAYYLYRPPISGSPFLVWLSMSFMSVFMDLGYLCRFENRSSTCREPTVC